MAIPPSPAGQDAGLTPDATPQDVPGPEFDAEIGQDAGEEIVSAAGLDGDPGDGDAATLVLADSLDLTAAAPLASALVAARGAPAVIDASGVRRIGAQCLQVLLSARATWSGDGQAWSVIDPSPEFADSVALMGCPQLADATLVQD